MPEPLDAISFCCGRPFRTPISSSQRMVIRSCPGCGLLTGHHEDERAGKYWNDEYLPEAFLHALRRRREIQAASVVSILRDHDAPGPVLDYGCGQGVLLAELLSAGMDAWGCDLDPDAPLSAVDRERFRALSEPWEIPDGEWGTIVLLDVLEHHSDPVSFLRELPCRSLFLKVPTATGPAASTARVLARGGRPGQLEALFLYGETAPHRWLGTRRGLTRIAAQAGWQQRWRGSVLEVGAELPDRIRPTPTGALRRGVLGAVGMATAAVGPVWSDTELAYYERSPSPA